MEKTYSISHYKKRGRDTMENREIAKKVIELVGGKENIQSVAHCATRLRIITADKAKINMKAVENLDKVKGSFFNSGQYQIIFGTGLVNKIYDEVQSILGTSVTTNVTPVKKEGTTFQRAVRTFGDVFVPIIPVLVATGLFMGLRGLLTQEAFLSLFGMSSDSLPDNFILFTQVLTDTAFAFLPALVCWSTFRIFGGNPVIDIVIGLMLVSPSLPNAYEVGQQTASPLYFFGFIPVVGYQGSVLPAFITGIVGSKIEKFLKKRIPDAIDLIVTPFLILLSSSLLALFVIGPIFHQVELIVLAIVEKLLILPLGIGGLIYGCFGQLLGIFGIHHILNFLEISMLSQTGWNMLNPIGTCGNMAQAGAVLAVAIKAKNAKMKQIAYPSALSATLGITEPAVFGVTLRLGKPFIMSMIAGGVSGFLASILGLKATGMALTGIPGTLLYLNNQLPIYLFVNIVAMAVAFVLTYTIGYKEVPEEAEQTAMPTQTTAEAVSRSENSEEVVLCAALSGKAIPLEEVEDEVFNKGMLGQGIAIIPKEGKVFAPCDGVISTIPSTRHAVGIAGPANTEILIHVGMDTVQLEGKFFDCKVAVGDAIKKGDVLLEFDMNEIQSAGYQLVTPMVVCNSDNYSDIVVLANGEIQSGTKLLQIKSK